MLGNEIIQGVPGVLKWASPLSCVCAADSSYTFTLSCFTMFSIYFQELERKVSSLEEKVTAGPSSNLPDIRQAIREEVQVRQVV